MKNENEINYKDVMALGFKRTEGSDSVFKGQYGFEYFMVSMKLDAHIDADWDCNTRNVRILRMGKEGTILSEIKIESLDELKKYMNFYGKYKYPKNVCTPSIYTQAC